MEGQRRNPAAVRSFATDHQTRQQLAALVARQGVSQSQVIRDAIARAHHQLVGSDA